MYEETYEGDESEVSRIIFIDQGDLTKFGLFYEAALGKKY